MTVTKTHDVKRAGRLCSMLLMSSVLKRCCTDSIHQEESARICPSSGSRQVGYSFGCSEVRMMGATPSKRDEASNLRVHSSPGNDSSSGRAYLGTAGHGQGSQMCPSLEGIYIKGFVHTVINAAYELSPTLDLSTPMLRVTTFLHGKESGVS